MAGVTPLAPGAILSARFEIQSTLGKGGFSIAYIARDLDQKDECVVKELAPIGAVREGVALDLSPLQTTSPARLRKRFLEEANLIAGLDAPGVLHLREAFEDNGTAYYVTDMVQDSRTLERLLAQEGRLSGDQAKEILLQLLDILEPIHGKKVLHRDIKPSNILISPNGEVFLIDFGAAREWHADSSALQTVLFTPGYAPIEQLSDRGRRGPATDIYAVCATAYHMLTGFPPRPSAERADGTEMEPLSRLRPDLDVPLSRAITAGLRLHYQDRPQTIQDLRKILLVPDPSEPDATSLEAYDATALRLKQFTYSRNECPVCGGVMENPRPLRTGICPVCRVGSIKPRDLHETLCPSCKTGILHHFGSNTPILFCPICRKGVLEFHKKGLLRNRLLAICPECNSQLEGDSMVASLEGSGEEAKPWDEWLRQSGRTCTAWICDLCDHQYEVLENGRWLDIKESGAQGEAYYPDEWSRIAVGLKPDAGNCFCDDCNADFWQSEDSLTLLSATLDPFGYAAKYLDHAVELAAVPWLGAGKSSGNRGPVCPHCDTEFDEDGQFCTLVHSPSVRLSRYKGRTLVLSDWHRLAQGLPASGEEPQFFQKMDEAMRQAYLDGLVRFDSKDPSIVWVGHGREIKEEHGEWVEVGDGSLTVSLSEVSFGRGLKKWKAPFKGIMQVVAEDDVLQLAITGEPEGKAFQLEPAELILHLYSGDRSLWIHAETLAEKIRIES